MPTAVEHIQSNALRPKIGAWMVQVGDEASHAQQQSMLPHHPISLA